MTITLNPELERIIEEEIRSGHFRDAAEVLDCALAALREREREHALRPGAPAHNLAQFLLDSPLARAELDLERVKDFGRSVEL